MRQQGLQPPFDFKWLPVVLIKIIEREKAGEAQSKLFEFLLIPFVFRTCTMQECPFDLPLEVSSVCLELAGFQGFCPQVKKGFCASLDNQGFKLLRHRSFSVAGYLFDCRFMNAKATMNPTCGQGGLIPARSGKDADKCGLFGSAYDNIPL